MLSPEEIMQKKCKEVPTSIYTAIDDLLVEKYDFLKRSAIITYNEICNRVALVYSDRKQIIKWFSDASFGYENKGWRLADTEIDGGGIVFRSL